MELEDFYINEERTLTSEEKEKLLNQNKRLVSDFQARKLEAEAQKHWDLFYKRNETRFFKDRHWTTREFKELLAVDNETPDIQNLLEVGCGVGNFVYPLIEELDVLHQANKFFYYVCDFSPRAVQFVRNHPLYDDKRILAFQCDITTEDIQQHIAPCSIDIITMIFVLSAITPEKFLLVIKNLHKLLKINGVVLFRDYGLYDMAQLRFKSGHKIIDNFYMRQDGTRSYYFEKNELAKLFLASGFEILSNTYIHRRTLNVKEGIDVPRIYVQSKFRKL
uniref:tRNA N(3)-methylcytidine methyltransferase n=1 Tax=Glossina palpalis gambiensis TaxID=67801 RepID=A0A1B0BW20_9MUSC